MFLSLPCGSESEEKIRAECFDKTTGPNFLPQEKTILRRRYARQAYRRLEIVGGALVRGVVSPADELREVN